jgi:hypothetical protein
LNLLGKADYKYCWLEFRLGPSLEIKSQHSQKAPKTSWNRILFISF